MICVRIYTYANSPSPEIADEIAPLIHSENWGMRDNFTSFVA